MRQTPPQDSEDELDYSVIAQYVEGSADQEVREKVQTMMQKDPSLSAFIRDLESKREPQVRVIRFPRVNFMTVLGYAAGVTIIFGIGVLLSSHFISRKPGEPSVYRSVEEPQERLGPPISVKALKIDSGEYTSESLNVYDASYALLIGIDDYTHEKNGFDPLRNSVTDMRKVASALKQFKFTEINTLENKEATRYAIMTMVSNLMVKAGPDGAVLVYYAGHGYSHPRKPSTGYIIPYDGTDQLKELDNRDISNRQMEDLAGRINVKHVFLLLDCCYAGIWGAGSTPEYTPLAQDYFYLKEKTSKPVFQVLAASGRQQKCAENIFADALVKSLDQARNDSFLSAARVNEYVIKTVPPAYKHKIQSLFKGRSGENQIPVHNKLVDHGGEYMFIRSNGYNVSYAPPVITCQTTYSFPGIADHTRLIPFNSAPGQLEFLHIFSNGVQIVSDAGQIVAEKIFEEYDPRGFSTHLGFINDFDHDGTVEIAVSATFNTNCYNWIFNDRLELLQTIRESWPAHRIYRRDDAGDEYFDEYTGMKVYYCSNINKDGRKEIITQINTGYGREPREVRVYDYETGQFLWRYPTAPSIVDITNTWSYSNDGHVILISSYSVANGNILDNGTSDTNTYLWLLTGKGECLWRRKLGGIFTGAHAKFVDLNRDGQKENITAMFGAYNFLEKDPGDIQVFDMEGNQRNIYTNDLSVYGVLQVPNYVAGENNLLFACRTGKLKLLDARLNLMKAVRFPSKTGHDVQPFIKGLLNTRFGEFVVLYCWEKNIIYGDPSDGKLGGSSSISHFYNIHVKICDKKTLEEKYRIDIADLETDDPIYRIQIFDADSDGEDEVMINTKDGINVYKLICKNTEET